MFSAHAFRYYTVNIDVLMFMIFENVKTNIGSYLFLLSHVQVTLFHFEDKPRASSLDVIKSLQNEGNLRVMMLTGDHELSAWRVANAVGIKEVHCSLKPEDKLYHVTSISRDTGGTFYYLHA